MKKLLAVLLTLLLVFTLPLFALAEETAADTGEAVTEEITAEDTFETDTADAAESTTGEESESAEEGPKTTFGFFPETLKETLPVMGMGMLGIFLVTLVIILAVLILSKFGGKKDEK